MTKTHTEHSGSTSTLSSKQSELLLFNDDVNTFDYVIDCLIEICEHEPEQAEQCAITAHFKGKCGVKSGSFKELEPINNELNNRGLSTLIS